jgi:flavorubredoxin
LISIKRIADAEKRLERFRYSTAHLPAPPGRACKRSGSLDVEMIVPQHGARFEGKAMVNRFLDRIENLPCGIELMTQDNYRAP